MKTVQSSLKQNQPGTPNALLQVATVFGLCAAVILLVCWLSNCAPVQRLEDVTGDWRFRHRGVQAFAVPINIIEIDRESLYEDPNSKDIPLMFWGPIHAKVITALRDAGARAIGFDVIQPQELSNLPEVKQDTDVPEAEAIMQTPQIVLAFTRLDLPDGRSKEVFPNNTLLTAKALGGGSLGYANTISDADGFVRRFNLTDPTAKDADTRSSFALAIAAKAAGAEPKWDGDTLILGSRHFRTGANQQGYIDFVGPNQTFPRISYSKLLANPKPYASQLKNSICLIGVTSIDYLDYVSTPFMTSQTGQQHNFSMAGVEVQANIVHTLLGGRSILGTTDTTRWLCIALAGLVVVPLFWLPRTTFIVPSALLLAGGWGWLCLHAFTEWSRVLPFVAPLLALLLNQTVILGVRLRQESNHRRFIENAFGSYVSPQVLEYMLATPGAFSLGGKRQHATILFSDIRGFTAMSETMEPEQVTTMLNIYLQAMVDIIFENGGTVDKFIGDGIMVKYNWPLEQPDHALRAVRTAVQMQRTVLEKMPEWEAMGLPNFQIGIGIHSGPAVLGNIGDARKMDQTAIGDTINVASRLESLCKTVGKAAGSSILLSDTSRKLVEKDLPKGGTAEFFMVQAGDAEIRGLSQPLRVYAVL